MALTGCAMLFSATSEAQIVTSSPPMIQTSSTGIVITYHADMGSKGLEGLNASEAVYAHTGVITSTSTSDTDWQYAPTWLDNSAKYKLTYVEPNVYTLEIGDIYEYYGITDRSIEVKKLMFVFRNSTGSKEGKTASGGDIAVEVYPEGFYMNFTSADDVTVVNNDASYEFVVTTTEAADIKVEVTADGQTQTYSSATAVKEYSLNLTFPTAGTYVMKATATNEAGTSLEQTLQVVRMMEATAMDYPGGIPQMGAVASGEDVTFCVAAPGIDNMMIIGSWDDYAVSAASEMAYQDYEGQRYFWITVPGLANGQDYIYYYLANGSTAIGDPYAHLILDPYNDQYISSEVFPNLPAYPTDKVSYKVPLAIYNSTIDDYDWEVTSFVGVAQSQLIIYELLIRDFTGTEGQANAEGTVKGVIDKLDYIQHLGVNAVELLPIMEFNGNNSWGYNTNFYFAPDKAYGTPSDYRQLIDECHKRGMAVILDIVFNQSDGLHPWYQLYPIAENPFYNGTAPHSYSVLNDWNQDNPLVQQQWQDALRYWLTAYNVDGFRFDLVKGLGNNDSYDASYNAATNTWSNVTDAKTDCYNASRVARMKTLHDAMREVNPNAYFINEDLATAQEENQMAEDGEINWANVNSASCQFAKGVQANSALNRFYAPQDSRTWGSTVSYAESHDEERVAYAQATSGNATIRGSVELSMRYLGSLGAQMLMTPGAHMIWQFQEIGADQTTKNSSGNDTSPKKVIWSYLDDPYHEGLMENYASLCKIRADYSELFEEGIETSLKIGATDWNSGRSITLTSADKQMVCLVACKPTTATTLRSVFSYDPSEYKLVAHSYDSEPTLNGSDVTLQPGAFAVYVYGDPSGLSLVDADRWVVNVENGCIKVEGSYTTLSVTDLSGRRCSTTGLARGIYIVTIDGRSQKVAVR